MSACNSLKQLRDIKDATLRARERIGQWNIGTRVDNGKIQVIRFMPDDSVFPVSEWMPASKVCGYLDSFVG